MTSGLQGVVVCDTALSEVDGERGQLTIAGLDVRELSLLPLAEVAEQLWSVSGPCPTAHELSLGFGQARLQAFEICRQFETALQTRSERAGLRLLLAALDRGAPALSRVELVGAFPVFVAALGRVARRQALIAPDPNANASHDCLRMLHGQAPTTAEERALDSYWAAVCDHGLNASTFTARVIASTGAELLPAVLGALGALEGPLHGGAPGPVLDMLDAIGSLERADAWLENELTSGRRLMGFGHRIYRVRDPRAEVLARVAGTLKSRYIDLARAVEMRALEWLRRHHPERRLDTNVEFYTALVLDALGFPRALFTPVFAAGRVLGWLAHAEEQLRQGRLIRPESKYVGARPAATH
jgi:citrate synthase